MVRGKGDTLELREEERADSYGSIAAAQDDHRVLPAVDSQPGETI